MMSSEALFFSSLICFIVFLDVFSQYTLTGSFITVYLLLGANNGMRRWRWSTVGEGAMELKEQKANKHKHVSKSAKILFYGASERGSDLSWCSSAPCWRHRSTAVRLSDQDERSAAAGRTTKYSFDYVMFGFVPFWTRSHDICRLWCWQCWELTSRNCQI